jgi:tetratricopeptide (TPR) repeat protein
MAASIGDFELAEELNRPSFSMWLTRLWTAKKQTSSRPPTTVQFFRQATLHRNAGRFEEAAALVEQGLRLDPDNVVGLLLSGSIHAVFREMEKARAAFEHVLTLDPTHPRALLGMARMALEEGETVTCTDFLRRALARYPDFPEATALLEAVSNAGGEAAPRPAPAASFRIERLRVPQESREALLARIDATLIFAQPRGTSTEEVAARTSRVCRLTGAMLIRCGFKALKQAVLEGAAETTFLRADGEVVLSIAFGRDIELSAGLAHLERVWTNCHQELAAQVAS